MITCFLYAILGFKTAYASALFQCINEQINCGVSVATDGFLLRENSVYHFWLVSALYHVYPLRLSMGQSDRGDGKSLGGGAQTSVYWVIYAFKIKEMTNRYKCVTELLIQGCESLFKFFLIKFCIQCHPIPCPTQFFLSLQPPYHRN